MEYLTGEYVKLQGKHQVSSEYITNQLQEEFDSPLISGCDFGKFAASAESSKLTHEELHR